MYDTTGIFHEVLVLGTYFVTYAYAQLVGTDCSLWPMYYPDPLTLSNLFREGLVWSCFFQIAGGREVRFHFIFMVV